ncbi:MAG: tRNA (guanosine(46)-N7)-methyltransferase TrmB [Pseudomonadota bacterium]|jgi:tRNA (guanine-N7-)-methyltransferase
MTGANPPIRSFGRVKSRTLKPRQGALLDTLLPSIRVPSPALGPIDPLALMPGAQKGVLEIGFGGGEHLAAQAERAPETLFIGAEPFQNGVASALRHIDQRELKNVRLCPDDVRPLLDALPDASFDQIYILFPDPWPKARHHKRRLIQTDVTATLARLLKPGGRLRFATDWAAYADWALERFLAEPRLVWTAKKAGDWKEPPADHVRTRYEEKRLGDIAPVYLDFERI